jgi:hypothetical protein
MWRVLVAVVAAVGFVAGVVTYFLENKPVAVEAPVEQAEWVSLFNGTTISHWRGYQQDTVPAGWKVVDGAITRVGDAVDLVTREQYANFEFAFEWKVPPAGNSGVLFRVTEEFERTHHTGPEYQVLDNTLHADGESPLTSAAANYALHAPTRDATRPAGQWNEGRLVVSGAHVEHWLNGEKVVEYELWTPEWKALVKASKFDEWPTYGMRTTGGLVLQNHGDAVAYRNLRVRRLQ